MRLRRAAAAAGMAAVMITWAARAQQPMAPDTAVTDTIAPVDTSPADTTAGAATPRDVPEPRAVDGAAAEAAALRVQDEPFGRLTAQGSYEIRALHGDSLLGREDWELYEDEAGFRTIRSALSLQVEGLPGSRRAGVTVTPELAFVEADVGSTAPAIEEAYATFRREGDVLRVDAFGSGGETTQQVRFPADGVFVSQVFATRGWELAAFEGDDDVRTAYVAGSAPGVLVGEVRTLRAEPRGRQRIDVAAGRFETFLIEIEPVEPVSTLPEQDPELDRWWVLTGSRIPAAAELPTLGVRLELVAFDQNPQPLESSAPGPILARGVFHHRALRRTEPLAIESWTLTAEPDGGYRLESQMSWPDGRALLMRALTDSLFEVRVLHLRRRQGRRGETLTLFVDDGVITAEARGGSVGLARQRIEGEPPVLMRLDCAALDGWSVRAPTEAAGSTYWMPGGAHPLGTLLKLPAEVPLGEEMLATPARTFESQRYASPAETPPLFRTIRWIFGPYRLPARVVFPVMGREAILVRYEAAQ